MPARIYNDSAIFVIPRRYAIYSRCKSSPDSGGIYTRRNSRCQRVLHTNSSRALKRHARYLARVYNWSIHGNMLMRANARNTERLHVRLCVDSMGKITHHYSVVLRNSAIPVSRASIFIRSSGANRANEVPTTACTFHMYLPFRVSTLP